VKKRCWVFLASVVLKYSNPAQRIVAGTTLFAELAPQAQEFANGVPSHSHAKH
jgi:hypothetical protein